MIVEVDPAVLGLKAMRNGVNYSFLDHSTSVREAAVDLVGKFVLSRPELIDKYYDMLSARILVRKTIFFYRDPLLSLLRYTFTITVPYSYLLYEAQSDNIF